MDKIELLMRAVIMVESAGNPNAIGDGGRAVGILQIHPIMVAECNRIVGYKRWTLADRRNPEKSKQMFRAYMARYGKGRSMEAMARSWNGGSNGWRLPQTKKYWLKVRRNMK